MTKTDPFNHLYLDKEEAEIEAALARGEFISTPDLAATKKLFARAAKNYLVLQKSKPITIRVNQADLLKVKVKAKRNRIPYQTLLGTLIHQYAEDQTQLQL